MASSYRKSFDVKDDECLLWIRDPSFSPFEKEIELRFNIVHKYRREILDDENQKNPKDILNRIKRRCFYNSALRPQIVEKIREYQANNTLRLYPYDAYFTYSKEPFTVEQCKEWANNHLVNPLTGKSIRMDSTIYMELLYTTMQYRLPTPAILNDEPIDEMTRILYKYINTVIKNVKKRLELIEKMDDYFLNNSIGTIDLQKNVLLKNSFNVSTSSNKSLSSGEKRKIMDRMLENEEQERLVNEYQHLRSSQRQITKQNKDKELFTSFRIFLNTLSNEVENGAELINNIVVSYSHDDKKAITDAINRYFYEELITDSRKINYFDGFATDNFANIIKHYIRNIYSQLINPSIKTASKIEYLSFQNCNTYFKGTTLLLNISNHLTIFMNEYKPKLDSRLYNYILSIIDDAIFKNDVKKLSLDTRDVAYEETYINEYYKLLYSVIRKHSGEQLRLPVGMGLLTDITIAGRLVVDENAYDNFTYDECKNWVLMPIINPRTFKPIKLDSPIYNSLLCMSFQYDTNLVPRMITSHGYNVILTLINDIKTILKNKKKPPQTRKKLEEYISKSLNIGAVNQKKRGILTTLFKDVKGIFKKKEKLDNLQVKWVRSMKQPKNGTEIINKKLRVVFLKFAESNGKMPFYVFVEKDDLRKCGIKADIAKNSYITIEGLHGITYYTIVMDRQNQNIGRREIINKPIFLGNRTDYTRFNIIYTIDECAIWSRKPEEDPVTKKIIYQDSKEYNVIFEQAIHFNKNVVPYNISMNGINFKNKILKNIPEYYSIGDCLRWVRQPDKNPKTGKPITIDSNEYNEIFERALFFDSNMHPLLISSIGMKFKKVYLERKGWLYGNVKILKRHNRKGKEIESSYSNSNVCKAINDIYYGDKKYEYFKDRMIKCCAKPHNVCIDEIKASIKMQFKSLEFYDENRVPFNYYTDSAIASVVIFFNNIKDQLENPEYNDLFTNNYSKINVSILNIEEVNGEYIITKTDAVDAGGPSRDFLTKFFEELFCDEEHPTRPFIQPLDNKEGKYYINPNFTPDEKFMKVIAACKKKEEEEEELKRILKRKKKYELIPDFDKVLIPDFDKEKDYETIYKIIGKVLSVTIINEDIGIPKQLSTYIITGLIKQPKDISFYELLYFYVCEFDNAIIYLNMIRDTQIDWVDDVGANFNDNYVISKTDYEVSKDNCCKFLLQFAKHIITKNFLSKNETGSNKSMKMRYASLFSGFDNNMRAYLANKKISANELNLMITITQLDDNILKELAEKVIVEIRGNNSLNAIEKEEYASEMKKIIYEIITEKQKDITLEDHYIFIQKLLYFWSGLTQYNKMKNYQISYQISYDTNGDLINKERFPEAHTCFYILDIYRFPDELVSFNNRKDFVYNKLRTAVFNTLGMDNQ